MTRHPPQKDYLPVKRSQGARAIRLAPATEHANDKLDGSITGWQSIPTKTRITSARNAPAQMERSPTRLRPGHFFSYLGLFLFTAILYARPAEFYPSPFTNSIALIVGIIMLSFFIPTQLSREGTLSAPLPEVKLALLLGLIGLLSVVLAMSPSDAWFEFSGAFIRCLVVFMVMVNVVRTKARLKGLLILALGAAVWLSAETINDYRLGLMTVEGYRANGRGGGIFGNSNDMALYLVTMIPITIAMLLSRRGMIVKLLLGACALFMAAAVVLTYSRGAFLGLIVALSFLTWKVAHRHKGAVLAFGVLVLFAFLLVAPGGYVLRLASIFVPSLDPLGSADARRGELFRSVYIAFRHPLLGIGMGNYASQMSLRGIVTHNSYTQVASEMGLAALACYLMFIVTPLKKLGQMVRETFEGRKHAHFYYMSLGLEAALIGYMVSSFFLSVAYSWYVYYLVGYAVCLRRLYESETSREVVVERPSRRENSETVRSSLITDHSGAVPR
jgi:putative inorganic carbon (hco3(-)) transporter